MPQVRRFVRAFGRGPDECDDLAQDVLVRIYLSIRSFRFQSAFSTWVFRVARNVCIDEARRRVRSAAHAEARANEPAATGDPALLQDAALAQQRQRAFVWAALRRLPPKFSSPIVLFDVEGLSYDEVASIEGVPIGTIRSRLARGRKRLRVVLEEMDSGNRTLADFVIPAESKGGGGAQGSRSTPEDA